MFGSKFNQAKCETTSRLCVGRIKLIRNKKTLMLKQSQKDIAELLRSGKQEYARIRVEGVIREKLLMQAYEILELYLELLTVRTQLIAKTKELPRDMMEAVSSIIYASQRISDLPELATLRTLFAGKYGKEYVAEAGSDATAQRWQVNSNLIRCLLVEPPQPEEKLEMLSEIAQEYGVEWDLAAAARDMRVGMGGPGHEHHNGEPGQAAAPGAPEAPAGGATFNPYPTITPGAALAQMQYTNAQQAAAAAAHAAAQATAAAQYAAQVAALTPHAAHGGAPGGDGLPSVAGWQAHPASVPGNQLAAAAPPPPPPAPAVFDVAQFAPHRSTPSPPPSASAALDDLPPAPAAAAPHPPPAISSGGVSTATTVGGYIVRSDSEIQRAYDAAQGPPTKGGSAAPSAVVSPPPPPVAPSHPPPAPPSPPVEKQQPSAPPPPPQVEDEMAELTRRLEALRKS